MNTQVKNQLKNSFPDICFAEPLSKHCTFRIGGPADAFIEIADPTQLLKLLKTLKLPFLIIGSGSNILFPDKGFRGVVIKLKSTPPLFTKTSATVSAGTPLQTLIKKAQQKGFYNLSLLTGIPGTVGGAVRGNAGANDLEIKDILKSAQILNPKTGRTKTLTPNSLKFGYRNSKLKKTNEIILEATFKLSKAKKHETTYSKIPALTAKRMKTQPYGLSAGSFFKNPVPTVPTATNPTRTAGYLIDQCGLKGKRIGGARISPLHANFIENTGKATQKDVLALAALAKKKIQNRFKITLKEEVQIVN